MFPFILILLTVFADHLTVSTLVGFLQFQFTDRNDPLIIYILIVGSVSFYFSGFIQGFIFDKYGSKSLKSVIIANLLLNGGSMYVMAVLPTNEDSMWRYMWLPVRLVSNLLTSELYSPFFVDKYFQHDKTKALANTAVLFCNYMGTIVAGLLPLMNVKSFTFAISIVTPLTFLLAILVFIYYKGSKETGDDCDNDDDEMLSTNSDAKISTDPILPESQRSSNQTQIAARLIKDPMWFSLCSFIIMKQLISSVVYTNMSFQTATYHDVDEKGIGMMRLITTLVSMILGPLLVFALGKMNISASIQMVASSVMIAILAAMYNIIDENLYFVVALVSFYAVFDFLSSPCTISIASSYSNRFRKSARSKIVSLALSMSNIGSIIGLVASREITYAFQVKVILASSLLIVMVMLFKGSKNLK